MSGSEPQDPTSDMWGDTERRQPPTTPTHAPAPQVPPAAPSSTSTSGSSYASGPAGSTTPAAQFNPYAVVPGSDAASTAPAYEQGAVPPTGYETPPWAAPRETKTNISAIVLLIVSLLALIPTSFFVAPSSILAIIALVKQHDDPQLSRKLTRIGWVVLVVTIALVALALFAFFAYVMSLFVANSSSSI